MFHSQRQLIRQNRIALLIAAGVAIGVANAASAAEKVLPHRSWQFQDPNWDHLSKAIPRAAAGGANRIQLSHKIVMDAEELWEGKDAPAKLGLVRKAAKLARENRLAVDMWTHELSGIPKDQFRDAAGKVALSPELWKWVDEKYERLFTLVPELDGLVLTFAETQFAVYGEKVASADPPPARVAKLIRVMADVCARHKKILLIRTFVYEPAEIGFMREALHAIAGAVPRDGGVIIMTKCVPHDWTPFYPFDPLLGDVAGLPQVVEIDLGQEFTGQSRLLHCEVEYVKYVMDHARARGVIGGVARVERMDNHALGTPNEVNLHAFDRLLADPGLSAADLWREWAAKRYGEKAAPHVIRALRRTFDITNLTLFPLEQWIADHTAIPSWGYAYSHITSRQNAKWTPSPRQLAARDELLRPTGDTLLKIASEKDLAGKLSEESLLDLERARPDLSGSDYKELVHYLGLGKDCVAVFRHHNLAMFATLAYLNRRDAGDAVSGEADLFRRTAEEHIQALRKLAAELAEKYGTAGWPAAPDRMRRFADEATKQLNGKR